MMEKTCGVSVAVGVGMGRVAGEEGGELGGHVDGRHSGADRCWRCAPVRLGHPSFAARFSRLLPSASTLCFRKTKQHVSKCMFSTLMNVFPMAPRVLGPRCCFQRKCYSQAVEQRATAVNPHPSRAAGFRQSRSVVRQAAAALPTGPSPVTSSPANSLKAWFPSRAPPPPSRERSGPRQ